MNILKKFHDINAREWERVLTFDQRMALFNFRVQVQISLIIIIFSTTSLIFDIGVARKLAAWLTSVISFVIGFWMPSPGAQLRQSLKQNTTEINKPIVLVENNE